jgi:L-lactate dehydrogenase complex protein LldE
VKVALFATCIVDTLKPEIGFATLHLLEAAGCDVSVPAQSCCGQPNFNNGDIKGARKLAEQWLKQFEGFNYVVIPSGSCAAMLKKHAAPLFSGEGQGLEEKMEALAAKSYELSEFLSTVIQPHFGDLPAQKYCYHDSCSGLRELEIKQQPRTLLTQIDSLELVELANAEACCGFGGTFCVKYPGISCRLADDKIEAIEESGASILLGGDWGCLMHLQGRIDALGKPIVVKHYSELLVQAMKDDNG